MTGTKTGDTAPDKIVAALLHRAADLIESRHYPQFLGGPDVWTAMFLAADEILISPAVEQVRRTLGAGPGQFWPGTESERVAALDTAAGAANGYPAGYQDYGAAGAPAEY